MEDSSSARRAYAGLIRQRADLHSERLVRALSEIPREDFLGMGPWKIMRFAFPLKYEDTPDADPVHVYDDVLVALDPERQLNNGLPSAVARWIDAMDIQPGEHVVHAGCGTGYYTALIAQMIGSGGRVTALEVDTKLAARARVNLRRFSKVEVVAGDATKNELGPVDAIFVNAGRDLSSVMLRIQRLKSGFSAKWIGLAGFFPCVGAIDPESDRRLGDALAKEGLTDVRSLRREPHNADQSCCLHGKGYCFSKHDVSVTAMVGGTRGPGG
jgi:protein-L-isoaspartate(D-aspartate) O-methyltransferase